MSWLLQVSFFYDRTYLAFAVCFYKNPNKPVFFRNKTKFNTVIRLLSVYLFPPFLNVKKNLE
ncbi:hypothetical protein A3SI_11394 [Nitritalea halalkaliphila LW7]|uniref:Uncharacterized protein n=1 Tax=Nitritalea halalkaliphila LW7 TaxID=1189621 RepID=I5C2C2_9BACT|nr:hypothetical protein A3SI_11394 [Nitritalea halalkaliphila LW7]